MKRPGRKSTARELNLKRAWNRISPSKKLLDIKGDELRIIHRGVWNLAEGPDFKGAKIQVGGKVLSGDVEIHLKSSDWIAHGHGRNPEYTDVILHCVAQDDSTETGIPHTIVLEPSHSRIPGGRLSRSEEFPSGKCSSFFSSMEDDAISGLFHSAGLKRFDLKTEFFLKEMLESGSDRTLLRHIFEACGYRNNRDNFLELFSRFSEHEIPKNDFETILWGESGILPDPATTNFESAELADFVGKTWRRWWKLRISDREPIRWKYSGVRPNNMPERRIAALCEIIRKNTTEPAAFMSAKANELGDGRKFLDFLCRQTVSSHPLWDKYIFKARLHAPCYVMGEERASDIITSIILPALNACSRISGDKKLAGIVIEAYLSDHRSEDNSILRHAFQRWFTPPSRGKSLLRSKCHSQGTMHIYRNFCEECGHDCARCRMIEDLRAGKIKDLQP